MELIEREALREKAIECGKLAKQDPRLLVVGLGYVLDAPAIDAAPVVHGKWINPDNLDCHCSVCGEQPEREPGESVPLYDYCPYCGAQMDGGEDDG